MTKIEQLIHIARGWYYCDQQAVAVHRGDEEGILDDRSISVSR